MVPAIPSKTIDFPINTQETKLPAVVASPALPSSLQKDNYTQFKEDMKGTLLAGSLATIGWSTLNGLSSTCGAFIIPGLLSTPTKVVASEAFAAGFVASARIVAPLFVGFAVGTGIEYLPNAWGGKRVSDHIANGLEATFGSASPGFIDFFEYFVLGGWMEDMIGRQKKS